MQEMGGKMGNGWEYQKQLCRHEPGFSAIVLDLHRFGPSTAPLAGLARNSQNRGLEKGSSTLSQGLDA